MFGYKRAPSVRMCVCRWESVNEKVHYKSKTECVQVHECISVHYEYLYVDGKKILA